MGKSCKSCTKPNHFAKMCRSKQVNEIAEEKSSSEEECNLIRSFDSCEEFEIMAVEPKLQVSDENCDKLISNIKREEIRLDTKDVRKIDIRRYPRSHKIKSLKALVRIDTHIINMTIDTGSPVSFLNWTTAKQLMK